MSEATATLLQAELRLLYQRSTAHQRLCNYRRIWSGLVKSIHSEWCGRRLTVCRCAILSGKAGGAKPAALEQRSATAPERSQGTPGSHDARRLVAGPKDRKATSRRGTARKGGIVGAARTAFTVRVDAERRADVSYAHPIRRKGWPSGRIRVQGLEGFWSRPGAMSLVQGSKGGRRLWSMGPGESEVSSWSWSSGEAPGLGGFREGQERLLLNG